MMLSGWVRRASAISLMAVLGANAALAHHSRISTYSRTDDSTIEGVVTQFVFKNPHVLLYVDVADEHGKTVNWMGEGSSATGWRRDGWTGKEFVPGDVVRITGDGTIDGAPMVWLEDIELLDPETKQVSAIFSTGNGGGSAGRPVSSSAAIAVLSGDHEQQVQTVALEKYLPSGRINFTGVTRSIDDPAVRGPFYGADPKLPYNDIGRAAAESFDITQDPQVFCQPPGLARQAGFSPYGFNLVQTDDAIIIDYEEYSSHREIPITDEMPVRGAVSALGNSTARYEGDSLIIETVNLASNPANHTGAMLSDEARITEVFTREERADIGTVVRVTVTVNDPKYLTVPWTTSRTKVYVQGYDYVENDCVPPLRESASADGVQSPMKAPGPSGSAASEAKAGSSYMNIIWAGLAALAVLCGLLILRRRR